MLRQDPRGNRRPVLVDVSTVPEHVAIIMDGNGRWAQLQGMPRPDGHREGSESVRRIVRAARRLGVRALTLYAFSAQNWQRSEVEVAALMLLLREFLVSEREEILDNRIRLRAIGEVERLPPTVREVLDPLRDESAENRGMILTLALSYGGREEIAAAARDLARRVGAGELDADSITTDVFEAELPSADVGPVDLMIRTGGEQRISNFLLWGAAYAELYFSPKLWPDYQVADLYEAVAAFQHRDRRFGRAPSDVASPLPPRPPGESAHV